jgi:allophanate hydrolase
MTVATYSLDFTSLGAAYAEGRLTPTEVVRDIYTRIAASGSNPIWIHRIPEAEVLTRAAEVEALRARGAALPLYGVPFAVKDNIDVAGHPTTAGCPAFSYMAAETAHAVQRLQEAGALLIGKTNLDQFATGLVGVRSPYGACANPFKGDYIAGGSSSGSALAVAMGLASFALGTDTAGSGRVPAGFTNVVGLKPTRGVVSAHGVVPACRSLDCVSVFALTCEDAYGVFDVARGYDPADIFARRPRRGGDGGLLARQPMRCGIPRRAQLEFFGDTVAPTAFEHACAALSRVGVELVEIDFEPFAEAAQLLYDGPWVAERVAGLRAFLESHADDLHPVTRVIMESAKKWSAVDAYEAQYRLGALRRRCDREWARMDLLAVPTTGTIYTLAEVAAAPLECNTRLGHYTNFVNLLDLAALAVPGPFRSDGLPAGVTLIAAAHRDPLLAQLGARLHRASDLTLGATGHRLPNAGARFAA